MVRLEEVLRELKEMYPNDILSLKDPTQKDIDVRVAQLELIAHIEMIGGAGNAKQKTTKK